MYELSVWLCIQISVWMVFLTTFAYWKLKKYHSPMMIKAWILKNISSFLILLIYFSIEKSDKGPVCFPDHPLAHVAPDDENDAFNETLNDCFVKGYNIFYHHQISFNFMKPVIFLLKKNLTLNSCWLGIKRQRWFDEITISKGFDFFRRLLWWIRQSNREWHGSRSRILCGLYERR